MSQFDQEVSKKLDTEILKTFSTLLETQKNIKEKDEQESFLLSERKIIYDLFMRVNDDRRVNFVNN